MIWGFGAVGGYYLKQEFSGGRPLLSWSWGRRPVLQYFLQAYALALVIVLAWIGKSKGFMGRNGGF